MGTRGVDNPEEVSGSHTWEVIQKTDCAVLSVPVNKPYAPVKNIVYASKLDQDDREIILDLTSLAVTFNAHVKILHFGKANDPRNEQEFNTFKEEIISFSGYSKLSIERKIQVKDTAEDLHTYLHENACDMLAILFRKRNFIEQIFHKSLTKQMSRYNEYPILVYPRE
jgi:nucleotide-binding universal stress UspA family protein